LLSRAVVGKVVGQTIDYVIVVDFSAFVKLVDYLGGVDVNVARTLDDYAYPIEGRQRDACGHTEDEIASLSAQIATSSAQELEAFPCRYKHIHFAKGTIHMNGEGALEFSRSRHGVNGEGSDFARSARQQEVIAAIKTKTLSLGIILNPIKVFGVFNILRDNINTNIQVSEFDDFINLAQKMQGAKISNYVIDFGDQGIGRLGLLSQPLPTADKGFQSILVPRVGDGNFSEIHDYVACIVGDHLCEISDDGIIKDPLPPPSKAK
jgi:anionic cell wall polymer biosynthesis LytR-Cps2A-Psr (LCP) family protein